MLHRRPAALALLALMTAACRGDDDCAKDASAAAGATLATLETRDGVCLSGDLWTGAKGAGGVVLLHMNPEANDRSNWPVPFLQGLADRGLYVLSIDRRGTGQSGGVATDAFDGDKGRYDVEAAVDALSDEGMGKLAIISASNGTTSAVDYAAWSARDEALTGVVLMTGGTYTENQTSMDDYAAEALPTLFVVATDEAEWTDAQLSRDPGSWAWVEPAATGHGTHIFAESGDVQGIVTDWVDGALGG